MEAREELYRIQTSRFWRTVNLYWRARRAAGRALRPARRLLGAPPTDWVGPDTASAAAAAARSPDLENRCEVVLLPSSAVPETDAERLAAAGHRVFVVAPRLRSDGPPYDVREASPGFFVVTLAAADPAAPEAFEALDRLRCDLSLGATLAVVADPAWKPLAGRLAAERAWATVSALDGDEAIAAAFPKISVVVVTWNGRDFNRLCLESLLARTEWPNVEILVVDNASTDGTRELLEEIARRDPRIRPIFHAENRGFAAACNAGLAAASGAYLVILNNDTVVTRGWATALVRHLAADPKLGLVGPVTNAIANAAKVDAGYADVEGLPAWAADWVRAHDREAFDIPMLALFCAALPRRVYEDVGPLDERFGVGLFEDDDYSRRVREKGYGIRCARDAFVHHWQMASFRKIGKDEYFALYAENKRKYEEKWRAAPAAAPAAPAPAAPVRDPRGAPGAAVPRPRPRRLEQGRRHLPALGRLGHPPLPAPAPPGARLRAAGVRRDLRQQQRRRPRGRLPGDRAEPLSLQRARPLCCTRCRRRCCGPFPTTSTSPTATRRPVRTVYDWIDDLSVFPQDRALLDEEPRTGPRGGDPRRQRRAASPRAGARGAQGRPLPAQRRRVRALRRAGGPAPGRRAAARS